MSLETYAKSKIKELSRYRLTARYHRVHKAQALNAVQSIEKYNGVKLTSAQRKLANDYAINVLGKIEYAPWLYVYTLVRGEFKEGWVPDNFYGRVVCPTINKLGFLADYKTLSKKILVTENIPDIAYYINGHIYDLGMRVIEISTLRDLLGKSQNAVFIKGDSSSGQGRDVHKVKLEDLCAFDFEKIGNCVIQLPIAQHHFFDEVVTGSVATLRITTVKTANGVIEPRASYLRFGRFGTEWVQSAQSVRVAIVNEEGLLDDFGYTQDWRRWRNHPDTNIAFAGKVIPNFKSAIKFCVGLHRTVPHFSVVGWDVAVNIDGLIELIEWNAEHNGIKFSEATTGPCFKGLGWEKLGVV